MIFACYYCCVCLQAVIAHVPTFPLHLHPSPPVIAHAPLAEIASGEAKETQNPSLPRSLTTTSSIPRIYNPCPPREPQPGDDDIASSSLSQANMLFTEPGSRCGSAVVQGNAFLGRGPTNRAWAGVRRDDSGKKLCRGCGWTGFSC
ncbi:hypothetical protein EDC01DRAFT_136456 [Geopyxis carbonaria]|nr:hypothetical protein EDC01DRAFT_136456 [Geopyxis carbonaria]